MTSNSRVPGATLVFVHGAGECGLSFAPQAAHFPDALAVDLPGHPEGEPRTSIAGYVEWLRVFLSEQDINRPVVCGHSMGGAIAQLFALTYTDELAGLILLGTGARLRVHPKYLDECEDGIEDPDSWLTGRRSDYRLVEAELASALLDWAAQIGPAVKLNDLRCCDVFDVMDQVGDIRLPTLVLCGADDVMTPVKYSEYLHDRIESSEIRIIEGGSHFVQLERPEAVNSAIEEFLDKLPPA